MAEATVTEEEAEGVEDTEVVAEEDMEVAVVMRSRSIFRVPPALPARLVRLVTKEMLVIPAILALLEHLATLAKTVFQDRKALLARKDRQDMTEHLANQVQQGHQVLTQILS